jgi:ubiquinone/menaquinone biosynthesis C-methylase UbiE
MTYGKELRQEDPERAHEPRDYILATGEAAVSRLELLDEIFRPHSRELLETAGLANGMRTADIGCGTGLVSLWLASKVGPEGMVVGVDMSSEQLRIAQANAATAGLTNVSFQEGSAYETNLPRDQFDLVYSRFLMCHLTDPAKALREMRALLKPDGILVCEDHDDGGIFSEPPTSAYKQLVEISEAMNRARRLDSYVGLKLPRLVREAGFARPEVMVKQIAELRGPNKRFWEITLREAMPAILAAHAATQEELDAVCNELRAIAQDETTLVMLARVTQVWACRDSGTSS